MRLGNNELGGRRTFVCWSLAGLAALRGLGGIASAHEMTWEYSVQVSAAVHSAPPALILSWSQDLAAMPTNYAIWRKAPDATDWGAPTILPGTATNFIDENIVRGTAYEYQLQKNTSNHVGYGYICAGLTLAATEQRGKIALLVDQTFSSDLRDELEQLQQDLLGDGWSVLRHDISRSASVPAVKDLIKAEFAADPGNLKSVFLIGHVPVPYSGEMTPDGHPTEHLGAWPADVFYGDMEGTWTDTTVSNTTASYRRNWNVPGDGKYDQSEIPGQVKLAVGRVDFYNMPGFDYNNVATFPSELQLLRNYLRKDHAYRIKTFTFPARGLVFNETGDRNGEAFAANAWRNYAPLLGPPSPQPLNYYEFLPILRTNTYEWAYATAGSSAQQMSGLGGTGGWNRGGSTLDFFQMDPQVGFVMLLGSWLGDWDTQDNLMRAVLATPSYGLTCGYVGRPHWYLHRMGIGGTIGESLVLTQNNHADGLYHNQSNSYPGFVHIALMGDPSLRLGIVAPPTALSGAARREGLHLTWSAPTDPVLGYYVYRAEKSSGPFTKLTPAAIPGTSFLDATVTAGPFTYMVRGLKLQSGSSGSYFNLSQGAFVTVSANPALALQHSAHGDVISWSSLTGRTYQVFWKKTLSDPEWTQVSGDIQGTGARIDWTCDTGVDPVPQRFYKMVTK